jgi:hypothetical protein
MSELIKQFIKAKPFLKTKRYLEANDWSNHVPEFDDEGREEKYNNKENLMYKTKQQR